MTDDDLHETMMNLSACTLPTVDRPARLGEFEDFFTRAVSAVARPAPTRLELRLRTDTGAEGRDLAARESACCSFFTFSFTPPAAGPLVMGIEVPAAHLDVLDALEAIARAGADR